MVEQKGCGEEFGYCGLAEGAVCVREIDDGAGRAEFADCLAASSAGLACGGVEVGDSDGADSDAGAVLCDGGGDGVLLGAGGEAVGGVFDVAPGDDGTVRKQDSGTDAEVAVGCVGVVRCCCCALLQVDDLMQCEGVCARIRRHDVSEAIQHVWGWQVLYR